MFYDFIYVKSLKYRQSTKMKFISAQEQGGVGREIGTDWVKMGLWFLCGS